MRRFILILLLLAIVAATAWTLLNWNTVTKGTAIPWHAMPQRSAVVIEIPDAWRTWDRFAHTSQLTGAFEQLPAFAAMSRLMSRTVERMENDAALKNALDDVPMLISITHTGGDAVDLLFACVPKSSNGVPTQAFVELLNGNEATIAAISNGGQVQLKPDTALPELSLSVQNGLWLLATSPAMMDEALLQLKATSTRTFDTLLVTARSTLGAGSQAHLLVHTKQAQALLNTWWTPETVQATDMPTGWVALDLEARADAILLSGLLLPAEDHSVIRTVQGQGVGRNNLSRWLPASVSMWEVQHVEQADRYLRENGYASDANISDFAPTLFNWVHGPVGHAAAVAADGTVGNHWYLFSTDDPESAVEALNSSCPEGCDTSAYRGTRMTRTALVNAHEKLLGPNYAELEHPWWCILGDVVVFAEDPTMLRVSIDAWNDGRTLAEDVRTNSWTQRIGSNTGSDLRWDLARCWAAFGIGMKAGFAAEYAQDAGFMQQFGGFSVQLSPARNGYLHVAAGLQLAPLEERGTGVLWSTPINVPVKRKPEIVRNHANGTQEVLIQDTLDRLHLIGSTGKLLWSRALDGPIMGDVHQVDRFRNGKLQYVFNTTEKLYLIDRNGKDVGDLPVKFRSPATAPIAVFDYDSQRDYRVLVPINDGRVLNLDLDGSLVKGWEPKSLTVASTNQVHHIRIRNKDHLLVVDGNGKLRLLDRRGEERETSSLDLGPAATLLSVLPGVELKGTRLIWTDGSGTLYNATLDGSPKTLAGPAPGITSPGLMGSDGDPDVVRIHGDTIAAEHGSRSIFMRTFGSALVPAVDPYQFGNGNTAYGVVIPERDQVSLLNSAGAEMEGMPLQGSSRFSVADLNLDGTLELVTVTKDGHVTAYELPGYSSK